MSIFNRFFNLCKADIHGLMDQVENKSLLLKQHLRDMEAVIMEKEAKRDSIIKTKETTQEMFEQQTSEITQLDQDLTVAIRLNKDDIARSLIKKLKILKDHQKTTKNHLNMLKRELTEIEMDLKENQRQYDTIELKCHTYLKNSEILKRPTKQSHCRSNSMSCYPTDEEIELELLKRKETEFKEYGGKSHANE